MTTKPEVNIELHQSHLRAFNDCPAKAKMMLDGVQGHAVPLFDHGQKLHEYLYAYVASCQQKGVTRDDEWADAFESITEDRRLAKAIRQFPLTVIIRPEFVVEGLEQGFKVELEHCTFAGRIDRLELDLEQRLWRVIDYKSGFKPLVQEEPPRQLLLYAAAVNRLKAEEGDRFEVWLVYPEANENLPPSMWTLTQDDLAEVLPNLDTVAQGLQKIDRWDATPSQSACQACPYLMGYCPLWDPDKDVDELPVLATQEMAEWAWQVRRWADQAVKEWAKEHGPVMGYNFAPPKYIEEGSTHWRPAGSLRSKAGKANLQELLRSLFHRAAVAGDVVLSQALEIKSYWLNRVMADEESEVAKAIRPFVEPVQVVAEFRKHYGEEE